MNKSEKYIQKMIVSYFIKGSEKHMSRQVSLLDNQYSN